MHQKKELSHVLVTQPFFVFFCEKVHFAVDDKAPRLCYNGAKDGACLRTRPRQKT